ncbi:unnamed protein product [Candida verbasci]|uniref:F-box domain-containing protein n=1 Tax=Candida verbasci TaxID=1227364 RepID=A0A9W4XBE2_9ASCO|nr:unnamed protein product [Candida verbasci]
MNNDSSNEFNYPLCEEEAKFEYKLINGKLFNNVPRKITSTKEQQQTIQGNIETRQRRKRNIKEEEEEEEEELYEQESLISCDDMTLSDTDNQSQVSSSAHDINGYSQRSSSINHPPSKKRLTNQNSEFIGSFEVVDSPESLSTSTTNSSMSIIITNNSNITSQQIPNRIRSANTMNSPSHTPVSDIEEDIIQQLPLPSPSASPVQSDAEKEITTIPKHISISNILKSTPSTQSELVNMVFQLSKFLNSRNQNHLIFKLLQSTNRSSLSTFNGLIYNSLKRDLLTDLPFEITMKILMYLDYQTLLSLSKVCKKWFQIINNPDLWIRLIKRDSLITAHSEIKQCLMDPNLISEWCTLPQGHINTAQILYKKRTIIVNRWMNPNYTPKRISVNGHLNKVVTCLQHDDEKIVTGVDDKYILIYSTKTGELMKVLEGHEGGVWALKYSGNTLVSGSTDRSVRIWNMKTGKCTHIFKGHTSTIRCLDIIHPAIIGKDSNGEDIIFPEFPLLITGSRDHNIHVWKLPNVDNLPENHEIFDESEHNNPYLIAILQGHTQSVRAISGYGNIIISGSYDSTVRVWDLLDSGNCKHILRGHQDRVYSTALDFNRKLCYSGSMDSNINIWNFETGELIHVSEGHSSLVGLLNLVDDLLVSAAADSTLGVWNPANGELISKLKGHGAAITCFEHDGLRVVSGSEKMLKLWDIRKGEFARDLLNDVTGGIWQVRIDYKRCVAAVQRTRQDEDDETYIEILDFSEPLVRMQ